MAKKKQIKEEISVPEINDVVEVEIEIVMTTKHVKEGNKHIVSGSVAKALIKKGIAKLV